MSTYNQNMTGLSKYYDDRDPPTLGRGESYKMQGLRYSATRQLYGSEGNQNSSTTSTKGERSAHTNNADGRSLTSHGTGNGYAAAFSSYNKGSIRGGLSQDENVHHHSDHSRNSGSSRESSDRDFIDASFTGNHDPFITNPVKNKPQSTSDTNLAHQTRRSVAYTPTTHVKISPINNIGPFLPPQPRKKKGHGSGAEDNKPAPLPPLTFPKKPPQIQDPRRVGEQPPPLRSGHEAWWCCWCEQINPLYFLVCMVCEEKRCMECKAWWGRRETRWDEKKTAWFGKRGPADGH